MSESIKNSEKFLTGLNEELRANPHFTLTEPQLQIIEARLLGSSDSEVSTISISRNSAAQYVLVLENGQNINVFIKSSFSFRAQLELNVSQACMEEGINTFTPFCIIPGRRGSDKVYWCTKTVLGITPVSTMAPNSEEELAKIVWTGFEMLSRLNTLGYSHNDPYPHKNIAINTAIFHQPISKFDPLQAGYIFDFEWCLGSEPGHPQPWQACLNDIHRFIQGVKENLIASNNTELVETLESLYVEIGEEYENKYPLV